MRSPNWTWNLPPVIHESPWFHRPCAATISGAMPIRSRWVALLMQKPCPGISGSPAATHTSLQRDMNQFLVIGDQPPWAVSKEKRGAWGGMFELEERWCLRAVMGHVLGDGLCWVYDPPIRLYDELSISDLHSLSTHFLLTAHYSLHTHVAHARVLTSSL